LRKKEMNVRCMRIYVPWASAALSLMLVGVGTAADQPAVRVTLQPANERKAAPEFMLKDRSDKIVTLENYRAKVVLLDFWATWCTGCKKEIPGFPNSRGGTDQRASPWSAFRWMKKAGTL
jgi:thiol-disulfide isomerase/thioredoxin